MEEFYRTIKADGSTFKNTCQKIECDPTKLKEYSKQHFNHLIDKDDPIELTDAPAFITKLQEVNIDIRTAPPDHQEVREVLTHLKNGKAANDIPAAYLKYAAQSEELIDEMVRLYSIVWNTHQIPKEKLTTLKRTEHYKLDQHWNDCQLLDQQQGFRSGRGTADGIFYNKTRSTNNRPNEKAYVFTIC